MDEHTTYKMSFDGHLSPTVRRFGLWNKNGQIILQDPQTGQGMEVWDGGTRKVLIGRLDDDSIGQEIRGGKIYSTLIRSGGPGDTSYIELGVGFEPLTVKENGKTALNIWASGGGLFQIYDTNLNNMVGQILPTESFYGTGGLKIHARNNAGNDKNVAIRGTYIDLHPTNLCSVMGNFDVTGSYKNCVVNTSQGMVALSVRESLDIRFVDEGRGALIDGQCRIDLEPLFVEVIEPNTDATPWHVQLTPFSPASLYVAEIGDTHFVVRDQALGNGMFCWRLSGVRAGAAGIRFAPRGVEGNLLASNWEDDLVKEHPLEIDTAVLESNWEDDLL